MEGLAGGSPTLYVTALHTLYPLYLYCVSLVRERHDLTSLIQGSLPRW